MNQSRNCVNGLCSVREYCKVYSEHEYIEIKDNELYQHMIFQRKSCTRYIKVGYQR